MPQPPFTGPASIAGALFPAAESALPSARELRIAEEAPITQLTEPLSAAWTEEATGFGDMARLLTEGAFQALDIPRVDLSGLAFGGAGGGGFSGSGGGAGGSGGFGTIPQPPPQMCIVSPCPGFPDPPDGIFAAEGAAARPGQPFIVGEKGPELFVPRVAGEIIPNDALTGLMGGRAVVNVNIDDSDMSANERLKNALAALRAA